MMLPQLVRVCVFVTRRLVAYCPLWSARPGLMLNENPVPPGDTPVLHQSESFRVTQESGSYNRKIITNNI